MIRVVPRCEVRVARDTANEFCDGADNDGNHHC
jgi:hypothetical protein